MDKLKICLVSSDKDLKDRFEFLTQSFEIQLITAKTLEEAAQIFVTKYFDGVVIDADIQHEMNTDLIHWAIERWGDKRFAKVINKPIEQNEIQELLKEFSKAVDVAPSIPESLLKEYNASIPRKIQALQNLIDEMRGSIQESSLKSLRSEVHKLAGNAGTYGYMEVSNICKEFEQLLIKRLQDFADNKNNPNTVAEFDAYLKNITNAFNQRGCEIK